MFADRNDAATHLLERVASLRGDDAVVLGLPFQPEVAMGAIGEGGARVVDAQLVRRAGVTPAEFAEVERRERATLEHRVAQLRRGRPPRSLEGRTAIIVDDGLATGSTAEVACRVARSLGARRVVVAAPIGPADVAARVPSADRIVCLEQPRWFQAVGQAYRDFSATSDEEVILLLDAAHRRERGEPSRSLAQVRHAEVEIPHEGLRLAADLSVPESPAGFVVFAHGSGSSRHSPRNRLVAETLQRAGLGTLLLDLLLVAEEADRANVFDIPLLGARLVSAVAWLDARAEASGLPVGYFGASTGAGAALWAAAEPDARIGAVVSRGGRPDLAGPRLGAVRAPTLLIVGGDDHVVLDLNRQALAQLRCEADLVVVPGATHLFEEPGTLAEAAIHARDWLRHHLAGEPTDADRRVGGNGDTDADEPAVANSDAETDSNQDGGRS